MLLRLQIRGADPGIVFHFLSHCQIEITNFKGDHPWILMKEIIFMGQAHNNKMKESGRNVSLPLGIRRRQSFQKTRHITPTHIFYVGVDMLMKNIIMRTTAR